MVGILIAFVNNFYFYLAVIFVYFIKTIFSNKLDLFEATHFITVYSVSILYGCSSNMENSSFLDWGHGYRKSLNRLLKVGNVPATSAVLIAFFSSFFAAAIYSTNEANKAAGIHR